MKVLCSACEAAEARVLCCADEAALCVACDRQVHAANRLAGKHQRLPLLSPGAAAVAAPKCDICQESYAYFFCLEDRALLCRNCDVAVHTANTFVSAHRRFLLTGVQVGLESTEQVEPLPTDELNSAAMPLQTSPARPSPKKSHSTSLYSENSMDQVGWAGNLHQKTAYSDLAMTGNLPDWSVVNEQFSSPMTRPAELPPKSLSKRSPRGSVTAGSAAVFGNQVGMDGGAGNKMLSSGGMAGSMPDWPLDEFFGFTEFNDSFGFTENGTSKADSAKLGSSEGSPYYRSADEDPNVEEFFGQVPEIQWSVPEIPSPPTASGLHWQRNSHYRASDSVAFVPDKCSPENPFRCFTADQASAKRRRRC